VRFAGLDYQIEPDALVASDDDPFYRPVEVKSYPDRAGKTDPADLRSACRQAAVAVIALRQLLAELDDVDPADLVPPRGDLVLRAPGSRAAHLHPMTLRGEVASLERVLAMAANALDDLESELAAIGPMAALDQAAVLETVPCNYEDNCREHCSLAAHCKHAAIVASDPILLGSRACEELLPAETLHRTLDLLYGRGEAPRTPQEEALQIRLQEAMREYERAVAS
jgi:hypothetical protein